MNILIPNDYGVNTPGLLALAQAMRRFGDESILAPDYIWSGSGHAYRYLSAGIVAITPAQHNLSTYRVITIGEESGSCALTIW